MTQDIYIEINATALIRETEGLSMEEAGKLIMQLLEPYKKGLVKVPVKRKAPVKKEQEIPFDKSAIYDTTAFKSAFPDWNKKKLRYYYDNAKDYSKQGNTYKDWQAAIATWARRDEAKQEVQALFKDKDERKVAPW